MDELNKWLASLSLRNNYSSQFADAGLESLEDVKSLTTEDLKNDLQISNIPDRKKLEAAILLLNGGPSVPSSSPNVVGPIPTTAAPSPAIPKGPKPSKTLSLLFIGETGGGKTTLINALYFYAQNKPLRQLEALIKTKYLDGKTAGSESNTSNQNQSQTTKADVHSFIIDTPTVTYEVKIMDTPGLGDTRGLQQDDDNISEIVKTVERTPELNAVFLILNGAHSRLTSHISYVIQKLKGMLPNVFRDNLFLILTNSPIKANLVLDKETLNVPPERQFAIDNSIFSLDFKAATPYQQGLLENAWTLLKKNIAYILGEAAKLKGVKTDAFQVIRENRDLLQLKIKTLQDKTKDLIVEKTELMDLQAKISVLAAGTATLKQVQQQSIKTKTEVEFRDTSYHNTICRACDYSTQTNPVCCHENCGLDFNGVEGDNIFKGCCAISNDYCVGSSNCRHHYSRHVHVKKRPVVITKQVNLFTAEQLAELNNSASMEEQKKQALKSTKDNLAKVEAEKKQVENELLKCFMELRAVCSDFNYAREMELSIDLVDERMQALQDPTERSQLKEVKSALQNVLAALTSLLKKMKL